MTALSSTATLGEVRQPAEGGPSYIYRGDGIWDLHVVTDTVDLTEYYTKGQIDTALGTRDTNITAAAAAAAAAHGTANAAIPATQKAAANGVASLDASGYVPAGQLGNVPAAPVASVSGRTGAVTLAKADVGLGNVDNTSDANKPVSTATQSALSGKQASLGFTPTDSAITNNGGRLGPIAKIIPDLNDATESGWYMALDGPSSPGSGWYICIVGSHASSYLTQTAHNFVSATPADTLAFRRHRINNSWTAWYKLQLSQSEQDARYVRTVNGSGPDGSGNVTVSSGVQDVRLGAATTITAYGSYATYDAPSGHVMTGHVWTDGMTHFRVRPIQKQVSGTWTTVSQV